MEFSVREARAQFATALAAAQRGERVTITKNGKPIAELGPPNPASRKQLSGDAFWEQFDETRRDLGLDQIPPDSRTADEWLADFNDPAWTREIFGPDYFDDDQQSSR